MSVHTLNYLVGLLYCIQDKLFCAIAHSYQSNKARMWLQKCCPLITQQMQCNILYMTNTQKRRVNEVIQKRKGIKLFSYPHISYQAGIKCIKTERKHHTYFAFFSWWSSGSVILILKSLSCIRDCFSEYSASVASIFLTDSRMPQ